MIAFLRKVFNSKLRLYFEYALLAGVLGCGAAAVTLYFQRSLLKKDVSIMREQVESVVQANQKQQETIDYLAKQRGKDAKAVARLLSDLDSLSTTNRSIRKHLQDLEKNNESVHEYLAAPLPPELTCVLVGACPNHYRDESREGDSARQLSDSVPPSGVRPPSYER